MNTEKNKYGLAISSYKINHEVHSSLPSPPKIWGDFVSYKNIFEDPSM